MTDFPVTSDPAPCFYCGVIVDDENIDVEVGRKHTVHACRIQLGALLFEAKAKLAELHALAAKHNPRAPTPEKSAEFKARAASVDPVLAWERITKALEPEEASEEELRRINDAWGAWDNERDPHKKAVLQMQLAECVAMLLEDGEAKAKRIAEIESLIGTVVRDALMQGLRLADAERRGRIAGLRWAAENSNITTWHDTPWLEADRLEAEAKREAGR